ncbi:hypothetical protein ACEPAI_8274 [Sanghuangporus weigelae]
MSIVSTSYQACPLPPEVLLSIFELATYNATRQIEYLVDLHPFEAIYSEERDALDKEALRMKHSLSLTCSLFRQMTVKLLYEDVWIRHGSSCLLEIFRASGAGSDSNQGVGRYVRRVILTPNAFDDAPQILAFCPNVRIISRASSLVSSNSGPVLNNLFSPQLHRINWIDVLAGKEFSLNQSPQFFWHSPTLRVLTLDTDNLFTPEAEEAWGPEHREILINLPQLHTLRLRSCDALGDPEESWYSIQLPSLRRLVLERPLALYALHLGCLAFYGSRIETLELGRYRRFLRIDAISIALGYCPNVETLLFPVSTTMPPAKNALDTPRTGWLEYRVKHIGLNASIEDGLDHQVISTWIHVQLKDLVDAFFGQGARFTALERITLYGYEWREIVCDEAFEPIAKAVHSSRVRIDCEDHVTSKLVQKMLDY